MVRPISLIKKIALLAAAWLLLANLLGYYSAVYLLREDFRRTGVAIASLILLGLLGAAYKVGVNSGRIRKSS